MDDVEPGGRLRFVFLVGAPAQERHARLAIESLRAFGGALADSPVWVFHTCALGPSAGGASPGLGALDRVDIVHLQAEGRAAGYFFAAKVRACALAEAMADQEGVRSLVWLSPESLIVQPPLLFALGEAYDAAFRTVHHRNVGSATREPLDPFWQRIYDAVGMHDAPFTTESFADPQALRPYFNSHCFALDPAKGICRTWWALFEELACDRAFQETACREELHRVFLHQAILSTLVARDVPRARLRLLPPTYSYPLHMHDQVPAQRRARSLDDLVCPVHEGDLALGDLAVSQSLRAWLVAHRALCEDS
ncbi:MAG: hypothetical protein JXA09_15085 [Anaerolineae bacterium]|nr:hypothetical protein [Anaerolineae bacterium]